VAFAAAGATGAAFLGAGAAGVLLGFAADRPEGAPGGAVVGEVAAGGGAGLAVTGGGVGVGLPGAGAAGAGGAGGGVAGAGEGAGCSGGIGVKGVGGCTAGGRSCSGDRPGAAQLDSASDMAIMTAKRVNRAIRTLRHRGY
jgi:hypothetical protein